MMIATTYLKNIWASTIVYVVINPSPHKSEWEHGVIDSNVVEKMLIW